MYSDENKIVTSLDSIYNTEENPAKVEVYKVQVQVDDSVKHWRCKPSDTIPTLLMKHHVDFRTATVTFDNEEIFENDPFPLYLLFESCGRQPIIVTFTVTITTSFEDDIELKKKVKVTDTIRNLLDTFYLRQNLVVFFEGGIVADLEYSFKHSVVSEGYSRLFIKNKTIRIQMGITLKIVDVSDCIHIDDVIKKVKGSEAFHNGKELASSLNVNEFIYKSSVDRLIFVYAKDVKPPTFYIDSSISACVNSGAGPIIEKVNICPTSSHWLAVNIYDNWIEDGSKFDDIVSNFQSILNADEHNVHLKYEAFYTSLLSRELDKLVENLGCFHQIPMRHAKAVQRCSESRPDFCISTTNNGIPVKPVLVADFKADENKFDSALWESFGYCLDVFHHTQSFTPILSIPGTSTTFALYLCFVSGIDSKLIAIKINEAAVNNHSDMRCFFFSSFIWFKRSY